MKKLITTSPAKKHHIPLPGIAGFERHLNRRLSDNERKVISYLETRFPARPVLIVDPPGRNSAEILHEYLKYRLAKGPENATAAVYTPNLHELYESSNLYRDKRIKYKSYRNPNSIRGHSIAYTLLLNTQDAASFSPYYRYPDKFFKLWQALLPMLPPYGFFIVHITYPKTKRQLDKLINIFGGQLRRIARIHPDRRLITDTNRYITDPPPTIVITLTDELRNPSDAPYEEESPDSPFSILNTKARPL